MWWNRGKALSGDMDGVEFIKAISHADAVHILSTQIVREQSKRVEVDKAYTSIFFSRIDGPKFIALVTGTKVAPTHPYLSRGMERKVPQCSE